MSLKKNDSESFDNIFNVITKIEQRYPVDKIKLADGTKIWNLIRVLLYFYVKKKDVISKTEKISFRSLFYLTKEGFKPFRLSDKKIIFCGFSGTENRKFRNEKFYDMGKIITLLLN